MSGEPARVPWDNLGAEEGETAPQGKPPRGKPGSPLERLRAAFISLVEDPPWPWLVATHGLVPWLSTPAAERAAAEGGLPLVGAPAAITARVHDKAWAQRVAAGGGLDPELAGLVVPLPAGTPADDVHRLVAAWPEWARARFTLKPAWGTSGRGRVPGTAGRLQVPEGWRTSRDAVLEPWLTRLADLSSLWLVDDAGAPQLLGVTAQQVRPTGVYLGCDIVGTPGVPTAGTPWDEIVVERARVVVTAAAAEGYRGPCGVDAFVWQHPEGEARLRSVVELNARFTAGHVALGLARRQGLRDGERGRFRLDASARSAAAADQAEPAGPAALPQRDDELLHVLAVE